MQETIPFGQNHSGIKLPLRNFKRIIEADMDSVKARAVRRAETPVLTAEC